jgi:hypothetical protein
MKDLIKHLSCLLIVLLASMALPSCGDDDDEPDDSKLSVKEQLIGTWEYVGEWYNGERETDRYTFKADGTGYVSETYEYTASYTGYKEESDTDYFVWSYEENTKFLKMIFDKGGDEDLDIYLVSDINSSTVIGYWVDNETLKPDYSERFVLTKVK